MSVPTCTIDRQKNTGEKNTNDIDFGVPLQSYTLQGSNRMMLLRIAISWATTIYPNAH